MKPNIRLIYLYLFSFVGLIIAVIGCVRMVDLGLKMTLIGGPTLTYPIQYAVGPDGKMLDGRTKEQIAEDERKNMLFQKEQEARQQKQDIAGALAMVIVGAPLYLYHWRLVQKEK
jgi:hypothetical protein